jgi:hypothetical protein
VGVALELLLGGDDLDGWFVAACVVAADQAGRSRCHADGADAQQVVFDGALHALECARRPVISASSGA